MIAKEIFRTFNGLSNIIAAAAVQADENLITLAERHIQTVQNFATRKQQVKTLMLQAADNSGPSFEYLRMAQAARDAGDEQGYEEYKIAFINKNHEEADALEAAALAAREANREYKTARNAFYEAIFAQKCAEKFGLASDDAKSLFHVLTKLADQTGKINRQTREKLLDDSGFIKWFKEIAYDVITLLNLQNVEALGIKKFYDQNEGQFELKSFAKKIRSEMAERNIITMGL